MSLNWKKAPSYILWEKILLHPKFSKPMLKLSSERFDKIENFLDKNDPRQFNKLIDDIAKSYHANKDNFFKRVGLIILKKYCEKVGDKTGPHSKFKILIKDVIKSEKELCENFINELELRNNNPHYTFNVNRDNLKEQPLIIIKGITNHHYLYNLDGNPSLLTHGFFRRMHEDLTPPLQPNNDVEEIANNFLNTNPYNQ